MKLKGLDLKKSYPLTNDRLSKHSKGRKIISKTYLRK